MFIIIVYVLFNINLIQADVRTETLILRTEAAVPYDFFGQSVSIYGKYALIGGGINPLDTQLSPHLPVAFLFKLDIASRPSGDDEIDGMYRLLPNDGLSNMDAFGQSVSLSKKYALVGAPLFDETSPATTESGAAYIFDFRGREKAKLTPDNPVVGGVFGQSVSISDGIALIGAPGAGRAYIFERKGANWIQQQELQGSAGDFFGFSVSISDGVALIGAPGDNTLTGAAYIYELGGGSWIGQQLTATDGVSPDVFGAAVSISGEYAFIGAPWRESSTEHAFHGAVYIFKRCGGLWVQHDLLVPQNPDTDPQFGISVSVDDGYAIVGAHVGDLINDGGDEGFAVTFRLIDGIWTRTDGLHASDRASSDRFGASVSIHGEVALVGAPQVNYDGVNDAGVAYVFSNLTPPDSDSPSSDSSDPAGCGEAIHSGTISNNADLGAAKSEANGDSNTSGMTNHVSTSSACKSVQYSLFIFISLLYAYIFNL